MFGSCRLCTKNQGKRTPGGRGTTFFTEEGFTLVEILAAMAVFTLLLGTAYSLYLFGAQSFQHGLARLDLQQNVRVGADFITRELRHAGTLEFVSNAEIEYRFPGVLKSYRIKHKPPEIVLLTNKVENKIAYNIGTLTFTWDSGRKILYYYIEGVDGQHNFSICSAVYLQNLQVGQQ